MAAYHVFGYFVGHQSSTRKYVHSNIIDAYTFAENWMEARDKVFEVHRDVHWFLPDDVEDITFHPHVVRFSTNITAEERKRIRQEYMRRRQEIKDRNARRAREKKNSQNNHAD